ncbi:MAG: hypothetical protein VX899_09755 [Myxococcota bacterium]|nr:hypothetical protein [Myxococcota bacterium]
MYKRFLVLGGAGLVGTQVVRHLCRTMNPETITVASLRREEAVSACEAFEREFPEGVSFVPAWGNLFVSEELANSDRGALLCDPVKRAALMRAVYGDFDAAYEENQLVTIIRGHRPQVIVDAVNTATGFSYMDIFDGAAKVQDWIGEAGFNPEGTQDLEAFLLSQSVPQLIRHVRFVHRSTIEVGVKVYVKVGTTGTGGMGMNIPYTHSEDRPSKKLLAKTEAAFGHTGLLFLLARTPDAPIVKEVKPAAMIGYRAVKVKQVSDKHGNRDLVAPQATPLSELATLELRQDAGRYEVTGALDVAVVDTGENGVFTRGEFSAITALGQMEYVTPEEIAALVVREIRGATTGRDIISALDGAVLDPSYKAGLVRGVALQDLEAVETASLMDNTGVPSIALGRLGPPELSKLLFEGALLRHVYGTLEALANDTADAKAAAERLQDALEPTQVGTLAPSIGIPVLLADGDTLLRGPRINVPEVLGHRTQVDLDDEHVDTWAAKGWVDLRARNLDRWRDRARRMIQARTDLRVAGSAAATIQSYMSNRFEIGEVVAWVFNNEMGGHRVK